MLHALRRSRPSRMTCQCRRRNRRLRRTQRHRCVPPGFAHVRSCMPVRCPSIRHSIVGIELHCGIGPSVRKWQCCCWPAFKGCHPLGHGRRKCLRAPILTLLALCLHLDARPHLDAYHLSGSHPGHGSRRGVCGGDHAAARTRRQAGRPGHARWVECCWAVSAQQGAHPLQPVCWLLRPSASWRSSALG